MGGILSNLTGSPETSESGCNIFWGHVYQQSQKLMSQDNIWSSWSCWWFVCGLNNFEPTDSLQVFLELYEVFRKYDDGNGRIPLCQLRKAFNEVHLYPSKSQIFEMVQCAVEYGSPCEPDHVTFGEFCILVTELKNHYHNCHNIITPKPKSLYREKKTETDSIKWKKRVFLGGSCNPTTWRQELAIPFLKSHGITFYNPQVQNWRPELLELEAQAKENADIMFFVIDKETRGISSMIEVGYLVASMKQVILVLTEIEDNDTECKRVFTEQEKSDLCRGRKILEDLVERNSVPVFTDIDTALKCTEIVLNQGLRVQDLDLQHGAQPVIHGHIPVGETLLQMREAFNSMDSASFTTVDDQQLTPQELKLAYKSCTGKDLDSKWLKKKDKHSKYYFEEFCCIMVESQVQPSTVQKKITSFISTIFGKFSGHSSCSMPCHSEKDFRDVYLGGSCGDSNWRDKIAIPILRKNGISYVNPFISGYNQKLIPIQVQAREKCRLLLYVITDRTRSLSSMIEAGYYVGLGCKVILCIQQMKEGAMIGGEKISECGVKDYARGRAYLADLANREGVHIFEDILETVMYCVSYLQEIPVDTGY
ncbi:RAW [Mytilus edulis]|uniref:RAW n=1 Tax=Mytilus edulis TaxID=6550 RepID=A0A8S3TFK5_MYTED|nr:RAW [Mytilus edulis]